MTVLSTRPPITRDPITSDPITDDQLRTLTPWERADLIRRLSIVVQPRRSPRRSGFVVAVFAGCAVLIAWMIALAVTLPARYVTAHFDTAWVGFDLILLTSLAATGWAAWRRVETLAIPAAVTASLLVCDAWLDITTASGSDLMTSVITAIGVELPVAAALAYVAWRRRPSPGQLPGDVPAHVGAVLQAVLPRVPQQHREHP